MFVDTLVTLKPPGSDEDDADAGVERGEPLRSDCGIRFPDSLGLTHMAGVVIFPVGNGSFSPYRVSTAFQKTRADHIGHQ